MLLLLSFASYSPYHSETQNCSSTRMLNQLAKVCQRQYKCHRTEQCRSVDTNVAELVIPRLMEFWAFYNSKSAALRSVLSIRDLLAWARFVNTTAPSIGALAAYAHGAYLVLLDGIGLGIGMQMEVRLSPSCRQYKVCPEGLSTLLP